MSVIGGILLILFGLAIMALGLFAFYALLPLFYAFFGMGIGLLIGQALTGDVGLIAIILGIVGAMIFAGAAYFLEPYRRLLLGISGGALTGLAIAAVFGLNGLLGGLLGLIFGVVGAVIGAVLVPMFFDPFIIVSSSFSGAAMVMGGANMILPGVSLFDRVSGGFLPALITLVLAVIGIGWQFANVAKWIKMQPMIGGVSGATVRK